jgi:hypothetical protein
MKTYVLLLTLAAFVIAGCESDTSANNPNRNAPAYEPNSSSYPMSPNAAVAAGSTPPATNTLPAASSSPQ